MPFGFLNPYAAAQAAAAAPLLLDGLSCTVKGAYGMRQLRSAFNGSCLRVRRSSDNVEQDIGFSNRLLDTVALGAFCGSGSGYVSKWYDQSSAGCDVAQAVAANQPQIVASGALVTLPNNAARLALRWSNAAGTSMTGAPFVIAASASAGLSVAQGSADLFSSPRLLSFVGAGREDYDRGSCIFALWGSGSLYCFEDGTTSNSAVAIGTAPFQTAAVFDGSTAAIMVNGVAASPGAINPASAPLGTGALRIGLAANGQAWDGAMAEHIVVSGTLSAADQATIRNSQQAFYGTP